MRFLESVIIFAPPAFGSHVLHIGGLISHKEVGRIDASRIVAAMKHEFRARIMRGN